MRRRYLAPLLSSLILALTLTAQEATPKVTSETAIHSVTVYPEYALVERQGACELQQGVQEVVVENLTNEFDDESIQVEGRGIAGIKILDVKVESIRHTETVNERRNSLEEQLLALQQKKQKVDDDQRVLNDAYLYLKDIRTFFTTKPTEESEAAMPDIEEWRSLMAFHSEEFTNILAQRRANEEKLRLLNLDIAKIKDDIAKLQNSKGWYSKNVILKVDAPEASTWQLGLSYLVRNAAWTPLYDVRADLTERQLAISAKAMVRNFTGEDWQNVKLTLSTAQPDATPEIPTLTPWKLAKYEPQRRTMGGASLGYAPATEVRGLYGNFAGAAIAEDDEDLYTLSPFELSEFAETQATSNLASTEFVLPYKVSQASYDDDQQVTIATFTAKAKIYHFSMPKASETVFLKARSFNQSGFPILPGPTQVFVDGKFVARSRINLIPEGEEMNFLLGPGSRVSVERKLLNEYKETLGFGGKQTRVEYEYQFTLKNHDSKAQDLVLRDQIPVSTNEEIEVKVLEPSREQAGFEDQGMLIWRLTLDPGEERKISLKFTVQYPSDWSIDGLQDS